MLQVVEKDGYWITLHSSIQTFCWPELALGQPRICNSVCLCVRNYGPSPDPTFSSWLVTYALSIEKHSLPLSEQSLGVPLCECHCVLAKQVGFGNLLCCYQLYSFVNTWKSCDFVKAKGFIILFWECALNHSWYYMHSCRRGFIPSFYLLLVYICQGLAQST